MKYQFNVRSALAFVTLCCILFAWLADHKFQRQLVTNLQQQVNYYLQRDAIRTFGFKERRERLKMLAEDSSPQATIALLYAATDPDIVCRDIAVRALAERPQFKGFDFDGLQSLSNSHTLEDQ